MPLDFIAEEEPLTSGFDFQPAEPAEPLGFQGLRLRPLGSLPEPITDEGPSLRAPRIDSTPISLMQAGTEKLGRVLSPLLGPTEIQRMEQSTEQGYRPLGSKIEQQGFVPAMFEPSEASPFLLPKAGQQEGAVAQVAAGVYNTLADAANVMTSSPGGVLTLGTGAAIAQAKNALRVMSGAFAADIGRHVPEQVQHAQQVLDDPNASMQQKTEAIGGVLASTAFAGVAGLHAARQTPTTGVTDATRQRPIQESRIPERPEAAEGGLSSEAVGRNRPEPSRAVTQEATRLTPEETAYLEAERAGIDTPVRIVEEPLVANEPFAGQIATIDRQSGTILINPKEFSLWLKEVPESRRAQAVRSLLSEEQIHLGVSDQDAGAYWQGLTAAEKAIARRRYSGQWRDSSVSDLNMGHEALRFRLQQLARMTPRELAEAKLLDRIGLQGLTALESAVRGAREFLGTAASKEQLAILDRIQGNLASLTLSADNVEPGAIRKKLENPEERIATLRSLPQEAFFADMATREGGLTGEAYRLGLSLTKPEHLDLLLKARDEARANVQVAKQTGDFNQLQRAGLQGQFYREAYEAATGTGSAGYYFRQYEPEVSFPLPREEAPAAMRKGRKDTSEQNFMQLPPLRRGETAERIGAVEAGAKLPTPKDFSDRAAKVLSSETPSFKAYSESVAGTGAKPEQLRDSWEDAVWQKVQSATGAELAALRAKFKLERNLGNREVSDAITAEQKITVNPELDANARALQREEQRVQTARQNYRKSVQRAVAEKLIKESYSEASLQKAVGRKEIIEDDLATSRPEFYRELGPEEARDPAALSRILGENFRASSALNESYTRRVVALVNRSTGQTDLVSAYLHPRTGLMVVDPRLVGSQRPNVPVASVLKTHRPVSTLLLQEPVRNFHQRFGSLSEFNEKLGRRAQEMQERQASPDAILAETREEGPSVLESREALRDEEAGAMLDRIFDEVSRPESWVDIESTVLGLADEAKRLNLFKASEDSLRYSEREKTFWRTVSGFQKAFDALREQKPDATLKEFYEQLFQKVAASENREAFQRSLLADYGRGRAETLRGESAPGAIRKQRLARYSAEQIRDLVTAPHRWYAQWLSPAIRANGGKGGQAAAQAADIADVIIDRQKTLIGSMRDVLVPAKIAAGAGKPSVIGDRPSLKLMLANPWLDKLTHPVSQKTGIANVVGAMEGYQQAPANVQQVVNMASAANLAAGRMVQPVSPGFRAWGGFQRNMTEAGFDMLSEGRNHPLWRRYVGDTALIPENLQAIRQNAPNVQTRQDAVRFTQQFFDEWGAALRDPATDANRIERINQDYKRFFPRALTHVKGPLGMVEIIHSHLPNYLEAVSQRAAWTRAFREQFPDTPQGRTAFAQLDAAVRTDLLPNIAPYWDALVKALQGRPSDFYVKAGPLRPGTLGGELVKGINQSVLGLLSRLALTNQVFMGAIETVGTGVGEVGWRNKMRGAAKAGQWWADAERIGQVNSMTYDWSFNPTRPVGSVARILQELIAKGFAENLHNELQGRLNAFSARATADRIRNQATEPLTKWEQQRYPEMFRNMQFTPDQVTALMQGDPLLLRAYERRFPAWISGENAPKSERSMASQKRWFNSVFRFQPYPMTMLNQFSRKVGALGDAWKSGDPGRKSAALWSMSRFLGSATTQGAFYLILGTLLRNGTEGVKIKANEAQDEPGQFMLDALMATLGGPYYAVWQALSRSGDTTLPETAARLMFPYSQYLDMKEAIAGTGAYRDQEPVERLGRYLQQKTPMSASVRQALAVFGLSQRNVKLDAAISGLDRWKRDVFGEPRYPEPEPSAFRAAMRRAVRKMYDGDTEGYEAALREALVEKVQQRGNQMEATRDVKASIRSRKKLIGPNRTPLTEEELSGLRQRIGAEAVQRIEYYDALLEAVAASL